MESRFTNYVKAGKVKQMTPDPELGKALLVQSQERLQYVQEREVSEKNAKFALEDAYEAARESAQALMSVKGFKPYSHEATISFVKEYYATEFTEEDISLFDHFRELRNNSVYKATIVLPEDATDCINFAKNFIKKVKKIKIE